MLSLFILLKVFLSGSTWLSMFFWNGKIRLVLKIQFFRIKKDQFSLCTDRYLEMAIKTSGKIVKTDTDFFQKNISVKGFWWVISFRQVSLWENRLLSVILRNCYPDTSTTSFNKIGRKIFHPGHRSETNVSTVVN